MNFEPGEIVMPGDVLVDLDITPSESRFIIGPGLRREDNKILASKSGILQKKEPHIFWVNSKERRYVPVRGDAIIGIIIQKGADTYRVDIGASEPASLSVLAFEGATKKTKPILQIGDLVYARLLVANKDMEPELVCMDSAGRKRGLGPLEEGFLITLPLHTARRLLSSDWPLLHLLGREISYEAAVGLNGRVWIKGRTIKDTLAVATALETSSECRSESEMRCLVERILACRAGVAQED
ncbi:unnamed protein product [Darwinula stevensoni]|uniref:Ribosomal RNA-processing protein 40 n=1 Tax=Darwinula stevensoni TaxID=69355 RepID=A0A7R8XEP2_9CRUS|nr:unnamed protein product [Darwinula stevensoni]CAG0895944.1 unnamed protein product [Darwinula stevensoni]